MCVQECVCISVHLCVCMCVCTHVFICMCMHANTVHYDTVVRVDPCVLSTPRSVPQVQFWSGQHRLYSSVLSDSSVVVADAVGNITVLETGYELLQRFVSLLFVL